MSEQKLLEKYESLDYDECENVYHLLENKRLRQTSYTFKFRHFIRLLVILAIGVLTALTACFIAVAVEFFSDIKFRKLQKLIIECTSQYCLYLPFLFWISFNAIVVTIGSALVTYIAPVAAGSGIPVIKCYLNGVKVPKVVRIETFFCKAIGVILSVVGGLTCGKEGPLIHCGAVIAAGISQGKTTTFKRDFKCFNYFRNDREKRDFVSAGAAAGVAASFGAPVGGVLFSLEEAASFWNQALTWRLFFCSMISSFTLYAFLSTYYHHSDKLSYVGFIKFQDLSYDIYELPIYVIMGAIGGILGALHNYINLKISIFRQTYLQSKCSRVLEATFFAIFTATIAFVSFNFSYDCKVYDKMLNEVQFPIQFHCPNGHYSSMGSLWLSTPEVTLQKLFKNHHQTWSSTTLIIFATIYFFLASLTYGLSVSSGLFVPSLIVGASWGRFIHKFIIYLIPESENWAMVSKFSLIGASAMLGGIVRMTISLTVIMIEGIGNVTFGLPIMITLISAKWVGDYFNPKSIYDTHIYLSSVPFLAWEPPSTSFTIYAPQIMSSPVITLKAVEKVSTLIDVLQSTSHNGFPVIDTHSDDINNSSSCSTYCQATKNYGKFRGLILRWQLIILLREKVYDQQNETKAQNLSLRIFRNAYPRYPLISEIISQIKPEEKNYMIDLSPVMNPSAYVVSHTASLNRIFRLFRALGLRHLVVVNDQNEVIGIVTRKDLYKFFNCKKQSTFGNELQEPC